MWKSRIICAGALFLNQAPVSAAVDVAADDPNIRYNGRFDFADPKKPRFDWPGTGIQARFTGASVAVRISGGENEFNVLIDGELKARLSMQNGKSEYVAAEGLAAGEHTLELVKRTEGFNGIAVFEGLRLADGGALLPPPARPSHKIQFFGDSYSAGYGSDATVLQCADRRPFDNNYVAYGPVTARAVDAEYSVQAVSGLGMVHNYGDTSPLSAAPFPPFYDRVLFNSETPKWDFSKWVPDLVVIALGTNDFSTAVKPSQAQYTSAYKEFIKKVRSHHSQARILCLTFSADEFQGKYVDAMVKELAAQGDERIHWKHMPALVTGELGCDWHPNTAGHRKFADQLIPVVRQYLGTTRIRNPSKPAGSGGTGNGTGGSGAGAGSGMIPFPGLERGVWVDSRGRTLAP